MLGLGRTNCGCRALIKHYLQWDCTLTKVSGKKVLDTKMEYKCNFFGTNIVALQDVLQVQYFTIMEFFWGRNQVLRTLLAEIFVYYKLPSEEFELTANFLGAHI